MPSRGVPRYHEAMGSFRTGVLLAIAAVTGCLFPDVTPLGGADGSPPDVSSPDVSPGTDAGATDANVPEAEAGDWGPCNLVSLGAVPGTTEGQVMENTPTSQQTIGETSGSLLVVLAYGGQDPGSNDASPPTTLPNMTFSVSDTLGNTYYAGPLVENWRWHQAAMQIFYAPNVIGGTNTVTVTSAAETGVSLWTGAFLQEYSGVAATDVVDFSSGQAAPSSTTSVSPPAVASVRACELVVGGFTDGHVGGQSLNVFSGWVKRSTDDWDPGGAWDNPDAAPAGTAVAGGMYLTGGADDGWVAAQMAFRGVNTVALQQPDSLGFETPTRTASVNGCSQAVVVQTQHGMTPAQTSTGITATLAGSGLTFAIDSACKYPISTLFIGAGTSSQPFYFKSSTTGSKTITVSGLGSAIMQTETVM